MAANALRGSAFSVPHLTFSRASPFCNWFHCPKNGAGRGNNCGRFFARSV
jgi:hypothetical protein